MKSINEQGVRYGVEAEGRWALPAPSSHNKAIGDSFPMDWNSRTGIEELREEAGLSAQTTKVQKGSLEVKGVWCLGMFATHTAFQ